MGRPLRTYRGQPLSMEPEEVARRERNRLRNRELSQARQHGEAIEHTYRRTIRKAASKVFTPVELDQHEKAILYLLCLQGRYHSSVVLAADLFQTTEDVQESRVLEWNLVELILADLNEKGLVTYRFGELDLFIHLRPTQKAYEQIKMAYTHIRIANLGDFHRSAELPLRAGDNTDFRSHSETAVGGPSITEDFIEHCNDCDHLAKHRAQLVEMFGTDKL